MTKYVLGSLAGLALVGGAAASPFTGPGMLDGSGLQSLGQGVLAAHSLETGELVYGGNIALGTTQEVVTYSSGIDLFNDPPAHGPFTASFSGPALRDDYAKEANAGGTNVMTRFRFVGGVANPGEQLEFFFLDKDENVVDSFNVTLPQGGNFIWTINLVDGDGNPLGFEKADNGFVHIQHAQGANFTWFATETLHLGANDFVAGGADGTWENTMYAFAFTNVLPAPGAIALLGLAGLVGASRRRRA